MIRRDIASNYSETLGAFSDHWKYFHRYLGTFCNPDIIRYSVEYAERPSQYRVKHETILHKPTLAIYIMTVQSKINQSNWAITPAGARRGETGRAACAGWGPPLNEDGSHICSSERPDVSLIQSVALAAAA